MVYITLFCAVFGASRMFAMEEEIGDIFRARQALDRELQSEKSALNMRIATTILCIRAQCPGIGEDMMLPVEVGELIINYREQDLLRYQENRRRFEEAFNGPDVKDRRSDVIRLQLRSLLRGYRKAGKGEEEVIQGVFRFLEEVKWENLFDEDIDEEKFRHQEKIKQQKRRLFWKNLLGGSCILLLMPVARALTDANLLAMP